MISLAGIVVAVAALGVSVAPPPPPTPLTDVQREMLVSGLFEADSFREPAFEALVENVRSWPGDFEITDVISLESLDLDSFGELVASDPGAIVRADGEVMMIDSVGDAFPGVTRLTLRVDYHDQPWALLMFDVVNAQPRPEIGNRIRVVGRAYKVMQLTTQAKDVPTPFPAMVGRIEMYLFDGSAPKSVSWTAIITALTGALAVALFIVVLGRHLLGGSRPSKRPLASMDDPSDDAPDA